MCEVLVTADGIELWTPGEAHRYGIVVPVESLNHPIHGDSRCWCGTDLAALLAGHPSIWRHGLTLSGRGWSEVGSDGRTWWEGFDTETQHEKWDDVAFVSRSDGKTALTLEEWEASHD